MWVQQGLTLACSQTNFVLEPLQHNEYTLNPPPMGADLRGVLAAPTDPYLRDVRVLANGNDDEELLDAGDLVRLPGYAAAYKRSLPMLRTKQQLDPVPRPRPQARVDPELEPRGTKRGRPHGAGNYTLDDVKALLDYTEAELPLGQRGWKVVHQNFSRWARRHSRPERALKSLETKYKQVCDYVMVQ